MPGHIYWKDTEGVFLGSNTRQAQSFGLKTALELVGKTEFDFFDKDSAQITRDNDLRVMSGSEASVTEEPVILDKKLHTFISHKVALKNKKTGKVQGVLGVSIDITKQKELEADYEERMRELAVALEVKKDLLNNMRHEIATPLMGFMSMTEELEHAWDKISEAQRKECLQHILNGRDRLMSLL